jgi:transcriptional regulator GlxA family with amidase domain
MTGTPTRSGILSSAVAPPAGQIWRAADRRAAPGARQPALIVVDTGKAKRSAGLGSRALAAVIDYMETHMDEPIRLSALAQLTNVSRFHFCRLFRRATGLSPMVYLERSRVERAQGLIGQGRMSLAEIALEVGFADQSHFTRRFQLHSGCTPGAFAREHSAKRLPRRPSDLVHSTSPV